MNAGTPSKELTNTAAQLDPLLTQTMYSAIESITSISSKIVLPPLEPLITTLSQLADAIENAFKNFTIPELSDVDKQEIIESNKQWGKLGWNLFQDAPLNFFYTPPGSSSEVAAKVKPYCSSASIKRLLDDLRCQKVNKSDLESAIFCYRNKQYKACSLLLFGLIEATLIRSQERPDLKRRRKTGTGAVEGLQKQFKEKTDAQLFYEFLYAISLFACLEVFFSNGNDFKNEPQTINRNFLAHGMSRRPVRKRDCIQLFYTLDNLMCYIEHIRCL